MKRDGQKPLMNTEDDEKLVTYRIIAPLLEQVQQFRDEHLPPYAQAGKSADMVHRLIWLVEDCGMPSFGSGAFAEA